MEETGLSGILDLKSGQSSKGSKLESALDKLGLQKRKVLQVIQLLQTKKCGI